jgi:hypothetical protein
LLFTLKGAVVAPVEAKILGFTEMGKRAYGLNTPLIMKEYKWPRGNALLARKDDRWVLSVARANPVTNEPVIKVFELNEDAVVADAKALFMTEAQVAEYEADGMMRRWGWSD